MAEIQVTLHLLRVLDAMLETPDAEHWGFELMGRTGIKSGTLYPLLARLEAAEWVESGWEMQDIPGRPRRRYYRLTGIGETAARRELARLPSGDGRKASDPRIRPAFSGGHP